MRGKNLAVNYDAVVDFLLGLPAFTDTLPETLSFEYARDFLEAHVMGMMELEEEGIFPEENQELTEVLLGEHFWGRPEKAYVTRTPGVVVWRRGQKYVLPLIIIELHF